MLDGDGCITLVAGNGSFRHPIVVVDSTDLEILYEFQRLYGGSLVRKKRYADHHRQAWSWRLYGSVNILKMLAEVEPYMRCAVKRDRARLLVQEWGAITPRNGHYTAEMKERKLEFEFRFRAIGAGRGSQTLVA